MMRFAAVLIAVWTLFGAPALCQAGVLLHGCHDSICGHETSCDVDPCSETIIKESPLSTSFMSGSALLVPSSFLFWVQAATEQPLSPPPAHASHRLRMVLALPLLI